MAQKVQFVRRITSAANPRFIEWNALRSRETRAARGAFLIDGAKFAGEAVECGAARCLIVAENLADSQARLIERALDRGVGVYAMPDKLIGRLSDTKSPQGVMAEAALPNPPASDMLGRRVVVLDGVQDPGNVGTIIRTADAAGLTGVLLTETCADPYSIKASRASMGSVFRVPALVSRDAAAIAGRMRNEGTRILVASTNGIPYTSITVREPWVIVIGSEGHGVSDAFSRVATDTIAIPMRGGAESLNAAVAAGILFFAMES